jgi:elongation factor Tu
MPVEDVFSITGRGTVATGRIETGVANTGDPVEIMVWELKINLLLELRCSVRFLTEEAGDNVGILLRGIQKKTLKRNGYLPGVQTLHLKAEVYILKKKKVVVIHRSIIIIVHSLRTTDVTGIITLPEGVEGYAWDNLTIDVVLLSAIALSVGLRFAIREGGRTVGAGQVTEIVA